MADRDHPHGGERECHHRGRDRNDEQGEVVERPPQLRGEAGEVATVGVVAEFREDRGLHRLGEDRVRGHDRHERELKCDHTAVDLIPHHDCRAQQDSDTAVLQHGPRGELEQLAEFGIRPPKPWP